MREDGVVGDCDLLGRIKVKLTVKFALTCHKDMRGGGNRCTSNFPSPSTLDMDGWSTQRPAALPPGKTRYSSYGRLGLTPELSGRVRKIAPPPGFETRTFHFVDSRYTNYAVPAYMEEEDC
jgi:hypothetical protein